MVQFDAEPSVFFIHTDEGARIVSIAVKYGSSTPDWLDRRYNDGNQGNNCHVLISSPVSKLPAGGKRRPALHRREA
jgi:hypothetical protein